MTTRVVCWNIAGRKKPWDQLREMDVDVALLQEASTPHLRRLGEIPEGHWNSHCWNSDWYKFYTTHEGEPAQATKQLDYVFASRGFHEKIRTCALNSVEGWGASDHCRLLIQVDG